MEAASHWSRTTGIGFATDLQLTGKRALVTGAGAGLGRGIAKVLAREGAEVLAVARSEADLASLADEVKAECGRELCWRSLDLTQADGPELLAREAGDIDVLVNNAGASMPVNWNAPEDAWQYAMLLNFEVHRRLTNALLPGMIERQWGRVISVTGSIELKHVNPAASAKAALTVWNKALAEQVGQDGITCNCVEPGLIESKQFKNWSDDQIKAAAQHTALKTYGVPEDIANPVAFLASPLASYITGITLIVDGGLRQRSF